MLLASEMMLELENSFKLCILYIGELWPWKHVWLKASIMHVS